MSVDETTVIPYILRQLNNPELAIKIASRNNLPGADDLYMARFQQLFQQGNFAEAAKVAATSPRVRTFFSSPLILISKGHFAYAADD